MSGTWMPPIRPELTGRPDLPVSPTRATQTDAPVQSFQDVLRQSMQSSNPLRVSAHAQGRLQQRGVQMSDKDWTKVQSAVDQARQKGARDAYLVYGQVGLIVNIPNSTVVTALEHGSQTVVTNIDSVVVV